MHILKTSSTSLFVASSWCSVSMCTKGDLVPRICRNILKIWGYFNTKLFLYIFFTNENASKGFENLQKWFKNTEIVLPTYILKGFWHILKFKMAHCSVWWWGDSLEWFQHSSSSKSSFSETASHCKCWCACTKYYQEREMDKKLELWWLESSIKKLKFLWNFFLKKLGF